MPSLASAAQQTPKGLERIFALENEELDLNALHEKRTDVDIAILDSGIDLDHPDLRVVERTNCLGATAPSYACETNSPDDGDDAHPWHGTMAAEIAAGTDNGLGGLFADVGVAAGARLWAVDVLDEGLFDEMAAAEEDYEQSQPWTNPSMNLERIIAGVKWVTAHADEIEVANMNLYCTTEEEPEIPQPVCANNSGQVAALEAAISESIEAGVVYTVAAGNWFGDVTPNSVPAKHPDVITVSAVFDSDGQPGGSGPAGEPCLVADAPAQEQDDTGADTSHKGAGVDIAAPGACTSAATPHVAGAAAILASAANPGDEEDVEDIRDTLVAEGNDGWTDESGDGVKEPLLDVRDDAVFAPAYSSTYSPPASGFEFPTAVLNATSGLPCGELTIDWPEVSGGCVVENFTTSTFKYTQDASPCTDIVIGELHIGSDGRFAAEDVSSGCPYYGASRCDPEPGQGGQFPWYARYYDLYSPPWTGMFVRQSGTNQLMAYLALCFEMDPLISQRFIDGIAMNATLYSGGPANGYFTWSFATSHSMGWTSGNGLSTGSWYPSGVGSDLIQIQWPN